MECAELPVPAPRRDSTEMKPGVCGVEYEQTVGLMDSPPRPRGQSRRQRRRQLSNPLLDTISAIEDDDDDECGAEKADGYMGGSSVDSGYKSCCPTPEMVDIAYYSTTLTPPPAADQQKRLSVASQASQASSASSASLPGALPGGQKPRIAMGTKVMSRQPASAAALEPRRRHDSGFSDANPQPQAPPRPSLLKPESSRLPQPADTQQQNRPEGLAGALSDAEVVQLALRPRSSSVGSAVAGSPPLGRRVSPGPPPRRRPPPRPAARHSSPHLPLSHRRQRSPSPRRAAACGADPASGHRAAPVASQRIAPPKPARTPQKVASGTTAGPASRATREEDIDALMYGRQLPPGAPAEEYQGDFTAAANIRWPAPCASTLLPGQLRPPADQLRPPADQLPATAETAVRSAPPKTAALKSKFSHMAQCMLDIIDELHSKGRSSGPARGPAPAAPTPPPPGCEYHTYEEVLYGALAERVREAAPSPEPPPLPERPQQLFPSARNVGAAPAPPTGHTPKQRSNFYFLFKSAGERRTLSHSLQQEVCDADGDDYGFAIRK